MIPGKKYKPEDILHTAWHRKWVIVLPLLIATLTGAIIAMTTPSRYRSDTLILVVPQRVPEAYVRSTVTMSIGDRLPAISQQILSRTRLEQIIQQFNLYPAERKSGIMEDVVDQMRREINVELVKGDAFRVSYVSSDPRLAMRVAERLAGLFIEENLRDREVLAEGTNQFLDSQLEDARTRLAEHEKKLEQFRIRYSGQLPDQVTSNMQTISNLQMQIQAVTESINRDRDRRLVLERQIADLKSSDPLTPAGATDAALDPAAIGSRGGTAAQQLSAARTALRGLELRLKPEHPDVVRMKRLIRDLEAKVDAENLERPLSPSVSDVPPAERARLTRLRELTEEMSVLDAQIAKKLDEERRLRNEATGYRSRVESAPVRESELTALMRDYQTLQTQYNTLLSKSGEAKMAANLERRQSGEQFRIIDPARIPERPFSPNRPRIIAIAIALGLALGCGLIALLEYRDNSLKSDDDVLTALALPVLAMIPQMTTAVERRRQRRRRLVLSAATVCTTFVAVAVYVMKFVQWRDYLPW